MLLTSSQVSVAVSSGVVFVFTVALFLSGYAVQQRTLRELRLAIKPRPPAEPHIFLPDRFKRSTTELDDGTVVTLDSEFDRGSKYAYQEDGQAHGPRDEEDRRSAVGIAHVSLTQPQAAAARLGGSLDSRGEKPFFAWWSRSNAVKPETQQSSQEDEDKPVSRAERRRRIKEEIQRLSRGEEQGYYHRRLW